MANSKLIKKLKDAYKVCHNCGEKYGVYSVSCSSRWSGKCDVCDQQKSVTEARDYGYLMTGIRKLTMEETQDTEVKYSSKISEIEIYRHEGPSKSFLIVRLEDEGGGAFISLADDEGQQIRLDFDEVDLIVDAVKRLKEQ